ncbi:MAG: hypothetical protein H7841_09705 [Magnetospirillum sp. WYHS-4]
MSAFRADAERVGALIAMARRHLAAGRSVDLSALEGRVRALCVMLAGNPPADGAERGEARALLGHLLQDLDGLERDLAARHGDPFPAPLRHQAARAFDILREGK